MGGGLSPLVGEGLVDTFPNLSTASDNGFERTLENAVIAANQFVPNITGGRAIYGEGEDATGILAGMTDQGRLQFTVTPLYSGSPLQQVCFFKLGDIAGSNKNRIAFFHQTDGSLQAVMSDATGAGTDTFEFAATWNPISGTPYNFDLSWDNTGVDSIMRLTLDGSPSGDITQTKVIRSENPWDSCVLGTDGVGQTPWTMETAQLSLS